jgi:hypothetical protein
MHKVFRNVTLVTFFRAGNVRERMRQFVSLCVSRFRAPKRPLLVPVRQSNFRRVSIPGSKLCCVRRLVRVRRLGAGGFAGASLSAGCGCTVPGRAGGTGAVAWSR